MINLLVLSPKTYDGVTWYRIEQFLRKAREKKKIESVYLDVKLDIEQLTRVIERADIFLNRTTGAGFFEIFDIIKKYKPSNKPLVIDIDDNYELINPLSDMYFYFGTEDVILPDGRELWISGKGGFDAKKNKERLKKLQEIIRYADLITTTTFKMKNWLENFNKNVVIIPNCIDKKYFPCLEKKEEKIIKIGWAGGSSHFADLMSILPSLQKIMKKYPHIHYYHIGQWFGVVEKYIPKERLHTFGWINADGHGYRMAYLNLDIGLCPLTDDEFNEYKSCIKWYEYSATKTTTLAKDMLPYNEEIIDGENGFLYKTKEEFEKKLEFLILNPLKRRIIAQNAYDFVYKYRNLDKIAEDFIFLIENLVRIKNKNYDLMENLQKIADFSKKYV
ncbi:MAG: glycosyltransferase [Candidatus Micrarchaeia archaeon]